MKALVLALSTFVSSPTLAAELKPARHAQPVAVKAIQTKIVGEQGWPQTEVKVTATFSNACRVPTADELILVTGYADGYDTLALTLATDAQRMCPANYAPVTVVIDLGVYTRPNDGLFGKIVVNGKELLVD